MPKTTINIRAILLATFLWAPTQGCAVEAVVGNLSEREANKIIELLANNDIQANKGVIDTGRAILYTISVPPKHRLDSIKLLNLHDYPRRKDQGYIEVFSESGLIPTSAEENAKKLAALEGEIQKQLKLITGILDAQVQLVMPVESPLRTSEDQIAQTTASVTLRYLPGVGGAPPILPKQIQDLVAAGVEKLSPDRVYPYMTAVSSTSQSDKPQSNPNEVGLGVGIGNSWLAKYPAKTINIFTFFILSIILILSLLLLFGQIRLRAIRGRLVRLQNEIAKARRRSNAEPLPPSNI